MKERILILGAGLSGVSTAYFLKNRGINAPIFEKSDKIGGLCQSHENDGFISDISGHLLHFRNKKILSLVKSFLGDNLVKHTRSAWVYSNGQYIPYPFQTNFHLLPSKIHKDCFSGYVNARNNDSRCVPINNFLDWINKNFGRGISRHFMVPYNSKFWKISLRKLSHDWAERFIVIPSLEDIKGIRNGKKIAEKGYHSSFYYPKEGGINKLVKGLSDGLKDIYVNCEATEINLKEKQVNFKNGRKEKFDFLISTIPLPEFGRITNDVPKETLSAFKKLKYLSIYNVNFGTDGNISPGRHWIYFPQKDISFFRVGFFHNISSSLVPQGNSSLYVDMSYSSQKPVNKENIPEQIKKDLKQAGVISQDNGLEVKNINDVKYGYPIYDKTHSRARETILKFLRKNNVISCGRFGSWQYMSMEDVILEGRSVVNNL